MRKYCKVIETKTVLSLRLCESCFECTLACGKTFKVKKEWIISERKYKAPPTKRMCDCKND